MIRFTFDADLRAYGYADGNYSCRCTDCETIFVGDKRSARCRRCAAKRLEDSVNAKLDKKSIGASPPALFYPTHRHKKTGGLYRVLYAALIESDLSHVVVYQGEDGIVWVRPTSEFLDRFEALV